MPNRPNLFISELHLSSFRGLNSLVLSLEPTQTVLIGPNNCGKSRILRALAIAIGGARAQLDDLTNGAEANAQIDVVVSPTTDGVGGEQIFGRDLADCLADGSPAGLPSISNQIEKSRFAWRTTIRRSAEGGVQVERKILSFDVDAGGWFLQGSPSHLKRPQLSLFYAAFVDAQRDLQSDLGRATSPIRRLLDDLRIQPNERAELQGKLKELNEEVIQKSATLVQIADALRAGQMSMAGAADTSVLPVPTRIEDLARTVSIEIDAGTGDSLPLRLHGSGSRSLSALLLQAPLYEQRLGTEASDLGVHPVTIIEEPEAHLHPPMHGDLCRLFSKIEGQTVLSSHSPQLAAAADPSSIRILRTTAQSCTAMDLKPDPGHPARLRKATVNKIEVERVQAAVGRRFGELLFGRVILLVDGATEENFFPVILRYALGVHAYSIFTIDTGGMKEEAITLPLISFAEALDCDWYVWADGDEAGKNALESLFQKKGPDDRFGNSRAISVAPSANLEKYLRDYDPKLEATVAAHLRPDTPNVRKVVEGNKAATGRFYARSLIDSHPNVSHWPTTLQTLIASLKRCVSVDEDNSK